MVCRNAFCVGDVVIKDTLVQAPQRDSEKLEQHHCVVVADELVFVLGKSQQYYNNLKQFLPWLKVTDYPWLDQDRYVDCCVVMNYTAFEIRFDIDKRLKPQDIKRIYLALEAIRMLSPDEKLDKKIDIPSRHIEKIMNSINDWALDIYSKPVTEL